MFKDVLALIGKAFILLFGFCAVFVFLVCLTGYVQMSLWNWFVVPYFGISSMNLATSLGISLLVSIVTKDYSSKPKVETEHWYENSFWQLVFSYVFAYSFGFVYHKFI